jgi:hypothetical protein
MPERSRTRKGKELLMHETGPFVSMVVLAIRAQADPRIDESIEQAMEALGCAGHAELRRLLRIGAWHGQSTPVPVAVTAGPAFIADPSGPVRFLCGRETVNAYPQQPKVPLISVRAVDAGPEKTVYAVLEPAVSQQVDRGTSEQYAVRALGVGEQSASIAPYRLDVGFMPSQQPDDATFGIVAGAFAWLIARQPMPRLVQSETFADQEIWVGGGVVLATLQLLEFDRDRQDWRVGMTIRRTGGPIVHVSARTDGPHVTWWVNDLINLDTEG